MADTVLITLISSMAVFMVTVIAIVLLVLIFKRHIHLVRRYECNCTISVGIASILKTRRQLITRKKIKLKKAHFLHIENKEHEEISRQMPSLHLYYTDKYNYIAILNLNSCQCVHMHANNDITCAQ